MQNGGGGPCMMYGGGPCMMYAGRWRWTVYGVCRTVEVDSV